MKNAYLQKPLSIPLVIFAVYEFLESFDIVTFTLRQQNSVIALVVIAFAVATKLVTADIKRSTDTHPSNGP